MTIKVKVDISAVEFRRLNSFEWAILTLLKTFTKDVPTIPELSSQLAIGEPMCLVAALDALHQVHAVVPRSEADGLMEIKDFEITELGLQVLKEEGWETDHGETFTETIHFDWPTLKFSSNRGGDHPSHNRENYRHYLCTPPVCRATHGRILYR